MSAKYISFCFLFVVIDVNASNLLIIYCISNCLTLIPPQHIWHFLGKEASKFIPGTSCSSCYYLVESFTIFYFLLLFKLKSEIEISVNILMSFIAFLFKRLIKFWLWKGHAYVTWWVKKTSIAWAIRIKHPFIDFRI